MTEIHTDFAGQPVMSEPDESMIIDRFMPEREFSRVDYMVVDAPVRTVHSAARGVDSMKIHSSLEAADFATFTEAGLGKVVADFPVRPYGLGRTLLTYETRTVLGDPASHRRFRLCWTAAGPFVGVILYATLTSIKRSAERSAGHPT
jgi:hypothetical protein